MVINMNETRLRTIEQIEQFLSTSEQIAFAAHGDDSDRMNTSVGYSSASTFPSGANESVVCCGSICKPLP
jgi:hypothetical protein